MGKKSRIGLAALLAASAMAASGTPARATSLNENNRIVTFVDIGRFMLLEAFIWWFMEDPAVLAGTTRHDGWNQKIDGVPAAPLPSSKGDVVSALVWGGYEVTDHLGLGANQRLVLGAFYRRDWAWIEHSGVADQTSRNNSFGVLGTYLYDTWHLSGAVAFDWGSSKVTSLTGGSVGDFDTSAYAFGFRVGRVFTLWGDAMPTGRAAQGAWPFQLGQTSVYFDPVFRVGYSRSRSDGFTNSAGAVFGKEIERAWTVGGSFTLSAVMPQSGGMIWRPYVEFSVDRQVGYRHTIDLPATSQVAHLDHDKTFWGVSGGVGFWPNRNLSLGVSGFYRGSGSSDTAGGIVWVRVNLFGPGGYLRGGR